MADCIVCEEREGTVGFGGCCTSQCQQMTRTAIEAMMDNGDLVLKERQVTARLSALTNAVSAIGGDGGTVDSDLLYHLRTVAQEDDGRTS